MCKKRELKKGMGNVYRLGKIIDYKGECGKIKTRTVINIATESSNSQEKQVRSSMFHGPYGRLRNYWD
jgi:hypothetical protein